MPEEGLLKNFAAILEKEMGTPKHRTEAEVLQKLKALYRPLTDTLSGFAKAYAYQSDDWPLTGEFSNVHADDQRALYTVALGTGRDRTEQKFWLSLNEIRANNGYLATANGQGGGTWPVEQQDEFAKQVGNALLNSMGIQPTL